MLTVGSTDYSEHSEILEFGPTMSVVEVSIPILADNEYEMLESFTVELKLLDQHRVEIADGRGTARVDIIDDDGENQLRPDQLQCLFIGLSDIRKLV